MMKSNGKFNLWFNVFILAGMTVAVVLTNIYKLQQPGARHFMLIFASIGALTGVMNTVLSANGNIWTFLFGVIDVSIASIVAFDSSISRFMPSISCLCSSWDGGNGANGERHRKRK